MDRCRHCAGALGAGARFCSTCGRPRDSAPDPGRTSDLAVEVAPVGATPADTLPVDPLPGLADVRLFEEEAYCTDCGRALEASGLCPDCDADVRAPGGSAAGRWLAVLALLVAGGLSFWLAFTFTRPGPQRASSPPAGSATAATAAGSPRASAPAEGSESVLPAAPEEGPEAEPEPEPAPAPPPPAPPPPAPTPSPSPAGESPAGRRPADPAPTPPADPGGDPGEDPGSSRLPPLPRTAAEPPPAGDAGTTGSAPPPPGKSPGAFPTLPRAAGAATAPPTEDVARGPAPPARTDPVVPPPSRTAPPPLPVPPPPVRSPGDTPRVIDELAAAPDPAEIARLLRQAERAEDEDRFRELCTATDAILALDPDHDEALDWSEDCPEWLADLREERLEVLEELLEELAAAIEDEEIDEALELWEGERDPATRSWLERLLAEWEEPEMTWQVLEVDSDDDGASFGVRLRFEAESRRDGEVRTAASGTWRGSFRHGRFRTSLSPSG